MNWDNDSNDEYRYLPLPETPWPLPETLWMLDPREDLLAQHPIESPEAAAAREVRAAFQRQQRGKEDE